MIRLHTSIIYPNISGHTSHSPLLSCSFLSDMLYSPGNIFMDGGGNNSCISCRMPIEIFHRCCILSVHDSTIKSYTYTSKISYYLKNWGKQWFLYVAYFILYLLNYPPLSFKFSLWMIFDFPEWWSFHTYAVFDSSIDVNEGLEYFAGEGIKVGEEKSGTITFNLEYNKFSTKQDKKVARYLLYMVQK